MKRRTLLLLVLWAVVAGAWLCPAGAAEANRLPEPTFHGDEIERAYFGDAENVSLLAGLLKDPDASVREQAVRDLGDTHNTLALPHIRGALKDADRNVRGAAVAAAAEFPAKASADIVVHGLADADSAVVLRALRTARLMNLTTASQPVAKLLAKEFFITVTPVVLDTLTHLKTPATPGKLKELLKSDSVRVRLAALRNVLLLDRAGAGELLDDLEEIAKPSQPAAVRAEAIVALAKFAFSRAGALIIEAGKKDANPLLRRAALIAYQNNGSKGAIRAFLNDKSEMVRIAAIRAAGDLKCEDCVERLFEILLSAPIDTRWTSAARANSVDLAARDALRRIGTKQVVGLAAAGLRRFASRLENPKDLQAARNVRACCWILGELKSNTALNRQLSLLESRKLLSPVLPAVVESLGKIGDERATGQLIKKMRYSVIQGRRWLLARLRMPPPDIDYSEDTAVALVVALARLKAFQSVKLIRDTAAGGTLGGGLDYLDRSRSAAVQVLPSLVNDSNREEIEQTLTDVLSNDEHGDLSRFRAAVSAGRLKSRKTLDALKLLLNHHRPERRVMHAAAWAIQEITGATPTIPNPTTRQNENWIVKKVRPKRE